MRLSLILAMFCLCPAAQSQRVVPVEPAKKPPAVMQDLITRAFQLSHCQEIEKGIEGQILRRLLTPKVGSFEYFSKTRILVVKDTKPVVECFAALVTHFDKLKKVDLVTRSFRIRYCRDQLMEPHGTLLSALRRILTPNLGRLDYDSKKNSLTVKDANPIVDEIASILTEVDVEPRQVLMNIQFVTTENASLWKTSIAPAAGAMDSGFCTLNATEVAAVLRTAKKDSQTQIVQAPKLVGLDHREASIFVGGTAEDAVHKAPRFEVTLVPHIVPNTDKLIVDVRRGKKAKQILVRSGGTIAYRYFDAAKREIVVFVTPQSILSPKEVDAETRSQLRERAEKIEAELRAIFDGGKRR